MTNPKHTDTSRSGDHNGPEQTFRDTERNLRDLIETQAREIERLSYNGIHTCSDKCQRLPCVQRREITQLREALELADCALRGANMNMNVVQRKVRAALAGDSRD